MANRMKGTVKWFQPNKGYGFITAESGEDYYVYHTEIRMEGFRKLSGGQKVSFVAGKGKEDRPMALDVHIEE